MTAKAENGLALYPGGTLVFLVLVTLTYTLLQGFSLVNQNAQERARAAQLGTRSSLQGHVTGSQPMSDLVPKVGFEPTWV